VRQRAIVHVGGPPGAGKTALVEALLARTDHMMTAVRCVRDDTLPAPRESHARTDPELRRYAAAGASAAARYTFPGSGDAHDAFFQTDLMQDFSHAVVIEGDCPVEYADLTAFVAAATGRRLLVRRKSDQPSKDKAAIDALETVLNQPGGLEALLGGLIGPALGEFARQLPELVEQERRKALAGLAELRSRPTARHRMRWAVADSYRGIERAQLVVVNIRDDAERSLGETLLADVGRLRKDDAVFADVMGPRGSRVPITAVVADLAQPTDPGTKKALARILRIVAPGD
jgi:hypothetical protein